MTLIAMLADTSCLPVDLLEQRLLPNVIKCAREPLIVLKKQAVEVLGSLCRSITENAVQYDIVSGDAASKPIMLCLNDIPQAPVILDLSEDPSPTIRRAVAALLPDVTRKLVEEEDRRRFAVTLSDAFASDPAALVRQAYLEISGPLIYIFKDNVPEELLEHFTGAIADSEDGSDGEDEKARDTFAPLIPAFAVAQPETPSHQASKNGLGWDVQDDHGRAIITAYNLPGVVLSVGELGWPKLRRLHAALALDSTVSQPRYLIASSIHDVAKAIGPRLTAQDLLPTFRSLTTDEDIEVVMRAFERFPEFLAQLPVESTNAMVQILCDAWHDKAIEDWRLREVLAEGLVATADRLKNVQRLDSLLEVLKEALYDRFTAVRTWACKAVSLLCHRMYCMPTEVLPFQVPLFVRDLPRSTFYHNSVLSILSALADDGHHKHRAT